MAVRVDERTGEPDVSVIVPARNAARWAPSLVTTLRAQTHVDWEAIVVDDGSTDDTAVAFERAIAGDARFRVLRTSPRGVSAARNTGLDAARGRWAHFLDADDRIESGLFARAVAVARADSTVEMVRCRWAWETAEGEVETEAPSDLDRGADLFEVAARYCPTHLNAVVVRREVLDEVGRFDVDLSVGEDWDLLGRLGRRGVVERAVPETLAYYRLTAGSATRRDFVRMCADSRAVATRHYASDPRVARPRPEHADGASPDGLAAVLDGIVVWAAASAVGVGASPQVVLDAFAPGAPPDADAIGAALFATVPIAAGRLRGEWPTVWRRLALGVDAAIADLAAWYGRPEFAAPICRALDDRVVAATLRGWRSPGTVVGMLRSPRLARGTTRLLGTRARRILRRGDRDPLV